MLNMKDTKYLYIYNMKKKLEGASTSIDEDLQTLPLSILSCQKQWGNLVVI